MHWVLVRCSTTHLLRYASAPRIGFTVSPSRAVCGAFSLPATGVPAGGRGAASGWRAAAAAAAGREWPLFFKGVEKEATRVAMRMLAWNVAQLLLSQGLVPAEGAHVLESLQRVFVALLKAPLPEAPF